MARRWRGTVLAGASTVVGTLSLHASSRADGHDVQPWLGLAVLGAIVGGALSVFDSWSGAAARSEQPTEEDHRKR